ncbi:hypothetical protein FG386_002309 [Cryptosporidium ryanae]|uniref:uncharacterized protein n=1 Tax=Cryptosporidium ryanae TaxID=515981 RepID=UPI00351A36B7|nr:hypothetical protein FG386_002309 [Cryptosporidium ryanae]
MGDRGEGDTPGGPGANTTTIQRGEAEEFVNFLFREGFFEKKADFEAFDLHSITPSLSYLIHKSSGNPKNDCSTVISDYSSLALKKHNQQPSSSRMGHSGSGIPQCPGENSAFRESSQQSLKPHGNPASSHEKQELAFLKDRETVTTWRANDIGIGLLLYGEATCFVLARMLEMAHTNVLKEGPGDKSDMSKEGAYCAGDAGVADRLGRVICWILGPRIGRMGLPGGDGRRPIRTDEAGPHEGGGTGAQDENRQTGHRYMTTVERANSGATLARRSIFILNPYLDVDEIRSILRYDVNGSPQVCQVFSCRADMLDLGLEDFELVTRSPCFLLQVKCSIGLTLPVYIYRRRGGGDSGDRGCEGQWDLPPASILKGRYLTVGDDFQRSLEALTGLYGWLKEHSLNPRSAYFDMDFGRFYYNRTLELLSNIEYIVRLSNGIEKSGAGVVIGRVDPRLGVGLTRSLGLSKFATPNSRCSVSTTASNSTPVSVDERQPESMGVLNGLLSSAGPGRGPATGALEPPLNVGGCHPTGANGGDGNSELSKRTGRRGVRFAPGVCAGDEISKFEICANGENGSQLATSPRSHYSKINKPSDNNNSTRGESGSQPLVPSVIPGGGAQSGTAGAAPVVPTSSSPNATANPTSATVAPVISTLVPGAIVRFRSQIPVDAKLVQGVPETDYFTHVQQVYYHFQKGEWRAVYGPSKNRQQKSFSVNKYGFYEAKRLAEEWRLRYLYSNPNNNGTGLQTSDGASFGLSSNGGGPLAKSKTRKRKASYSDKPAAAGQAKGRSARPISAPLGPNACDLPESGSVQKIAEVAAGYSSIDGMVAFGNADFSAISERELIVDGKGGSSGGGCSVALAETGAGGARAVGVGAYVAVKSEGSRKPRSELMNKQVLHPSTVPGGHFAGAPAMPGKPLARAAGSKSALPEGVNRGAISGVGGLEGSCLGLESVVLDQVSKAYSGGLIEMDSYLRVGALGGSGGVELVPPGLQKIGEICVPSGGDAISSSASLASTSNSTPIVVSEVSSPSISSPVSIGGISSSRAISPDKPLAPMRVGGAAPRKGGVPGAHNVGFAQNGDCHPKVPFDMTNLSSVGNAGLRAASKAKANVGGEVLPQPPRKGSAVMVSDGGSMGDVISLSAVKCENAGDCEAGGGLMMVNRMDGPNRNGLGARCGGEAVGRESPSGRAKIYSVSFLDKRMPGCRPECRGSQSGVGLNQEQRILDNEPACSGGVTDNDIIGNDSVDSNRKVNSDSGRNGDHSAGDGSNNDCGGNPWIKRNGWEEDLIVDSFFVGHLGASVP